MANDDKPALIDAEPVVDVFDAVVQSIQARITRDDDAVDIELSLRNIHIEKKGIFFRSNQKQSSAELRLATRIRKAEKR